MPVQQGEGNNYGEPRTPGLEEQKQLMRGILAAFYSLEIIVGCLVVCILGINGACCLCPRKDRDRLLSVMAAQRKAGTVAGIEARRGVSGKHALGAFSTVLLLSISSFAVAAAQAHAAAQGKEQVQRDAAQRDIGASAEEAQRALLAGMYGTFWSVKIVLGCVAVCVLGLQGACCLCPQSEQARLLKLQAAVGKKVQCEGPGGTLEAGKEK